jgi:phosphodiesterase/alkaline phosphatase D-like protein
MDDHEYGNNWQGRFPPDMTKEELDAAISEQIFAIDMARLFQMHNPCAWEYHARFWYNFHSRGLPFFVMDTRFERMRLQTDDRRILMSKAQVAGLETWLKTNSNSNILFLCSGSPIAPIKESFYAHPALHTSADTLLGYPDSLQEIINLLKNYGQGKKIVWLASDPHFSSIARLNFSLNNSDTITIYQICASGLYSPFPFINDNPNSYKWNWGCSNGQELSLPLANNLQLDIEYWQGLLCAGSSHFVRVDVEKEISGNAVLMVKAFDVQGSVYDEYRF